MGPGEPAGEWIRSRTATLGEPLYLPGFSSQNGPSQRPWMNVQTSRLPRKGLEPAEGPGVHMSALVVLPTRFLTGLSLLVAVQVTALSNEGPDCNENGTEDSGEIFTRGNLFGFPDTYEVFEVGSLPLTMTLSDVDADADLDIVAGVRDVSELFILRNGGEARFLAVERVPVLGGGPVALLSADVSGDARHDIILVHASRADILVADGTGGYQNGQTVWASRDVFAAADLDGDGDLDLASAYRGVDLGLVIFLNGGGGTFPPSHKAIRLPLEANLDSIHPADLDRDGDVDLAVHTLGNAFALRNTGEARFESKALGSSGPISKVVDLDGDGLPDVLTGQAVFWNEGEIAFSSTNLPQAFVQTAGDLDGDGREDRIVFDTLGGTLGIQWNVENRAFSAPQEYYYSDIGRELASRDLDLDGFDDLVLLRTTPCCGGLPSRVTVVSGAPREQFLGQRFIRLPAPGATGVAAGDWDGDGLTDSAVTSYLGRKIFLVWNRGQGRFVVEPLPGPDPDPGISDLATGDLDHDGDLDIVGCHPTGMKLTVLLEGGPGVFGRTDTPLPEPVFSLALADLNGDGNLDAAGGSTSGKTWVVAGDGRGAFGEPGMILSPARGFGVAAGDIDADGDADLLTTHIDRTLRVHRNESRGEFKTETYLFADVPNDMETFDLDGDGDLEMIGGIETPFFLNDGGGRFYQSAVTMPELVSSSIAIADVNQDGKADVIAAKSEGVTYFSNRTSGPTAVGLLSDCNGNVIPDSCDIRNGLLADTNQNGAPDLYELPTGFHRGDADVDGSLNISDPLFVLRFLFLGGPAPPCLEAADANDDADLDATDAIFVLGYLFLGTESPPSPGPPGQPCGIVHDPLGTRNNLGCNAYPACLEN